MRARGTHRLIGDLGERSRRAQSLWLHANRPRSRCRALGRAGDGASVRQRVAGGRAWLAIAATVLVHLVGVGATELGLAELDLSTLCSGQEKWCAAGSHASERNQRHVGRKRLATRAPAARPACAHCDDALFPTAALLRSLVESDAPSYTSIVLGDGDMSSVKEL